MVLECPTVDHIDSLIKQCGNFRSNFNLTESELLSYSKSKRLECIIHITPNEVFQDLRYQRWLNTTDFNDYEIGSSTIKHILLNRDNKCEPSLISSSKSQIKLNIISPDIFRLLNEKNQTEMICNKYSDDKFILNVPTMLKYNLRPAKDVGIVLNNCVELSLNSDNQSDIVRETLLKNDIVHQVEAYKSFVQQQEQQQQKYFNNGNITNSKSQIISDNCNILFLGTGSATPGKLRNTSAILVNFDDQRSMLLDCGEATYLQLNRFYGKNEMKHRVLRSIKAVFISHLHADHHFGLIRIIREWQSLVVTDEVAERLFVIGPQVVRNFLQSFAHSIEPTLLASIELVDLHSLLYNKELSENEEQQITTTKRQILESIGIKDLVTVQVPHCFDSHGLVITIGSGDKIVYTGDTMYSTAFDQAGRDALLMIHEATMSDDLAEDARLKHHSTISQAIQAAINCNARYTILTHFSQRYAKIAPISGSGRGSQNPTLQVQNQKKEKDQIDSEISAIHYFKNKVGIAFDFMNIKLNELWKVARLKSPLETLFADELEEIQDIQSRKTMKRKLMLYNDDDNAV